MNRRKGQNGTVVIQSGWYRVRWRMDIEGQEERIYMSEKVAPVVIDKDGNPKPASQAVQRLAREIVERSGANSIEHFNLVVFGEVSFQDQTKEYLRWAGSRDRKRIKDLVSVEVVLNKWILPVIGDLPLAKVNNITVKPVVDKMKKANLAAETVNKYVKYVKQVVASLKDGSRPSPSCSFFLFTVHALRSLPKKERTWKELDSCMSSDALLMNVFCCPGTLESSRYICT